MSVSIFNPYLTSNTQKKHSLNTPSPNYTIS